MQRTKQRAVTAYLFWLRFNNSWQSMLIHKSKTSDLSQPNIHSLLIHQDSLSFSLSSIIRILFSLQSLQQVFFLCCSRLKCLFQKGNCLKSNRDIISFDTSDRRIYQEFRTLMWSIHLRLFTCCFLLRLFPVSLQLLVIFLMRFIEHPHKVK